MIQIYKKPTLHNPVLFAAWPGMGNVALGAARYLAEKIKAQEFGRLESGEFFDLKGIYIRQGIIESTELPKCHLLYWSDEDHPHSIMLFIGEAQPVSGKEYELATLILDTAKKLNVKTIYTSAAMPTSIDHRMEPKVWVAATNHKLIESLKGYPIEVMQEGNISGMNGLILGIAKKQGLDGFCLLGEIPFYTTQIDNPRASMAVLKILNDHLGISIDFQDLEMLSQYTEGEIDKYIRRVKEELDEAGPRKEETKGPHYVH